MALPLMQDWEKIQTKWKSQLDPILANPLNNSSILQNISLLNGVTVINHKLGRKMQGWSIVDIQGTATIYRSAPMNDLTLTLTSNAAVIVNIEVF